MKCKICGKKTTNETSVGYNSFIVCNKCYFILMDNDIKNTMKVMDFIFKCGKIVENEKRR